MNSDALRKTFLDNSWLHIFLLIFICFVAYSNTFHVPFQFDDPFNILDKAYVRDIRLFFAPESESWFGSDHAFRMRTVGYFTFAVNYMLGGTSVTGYHLFNLFIHCVTGVLVYLLVLLTFQVPFMKTEQLKSISKPVALFSALLFVSHPIQTQAVTYIVQRVASLATMFYLLSFVAYIKARQGFQTGIYKKKAVAWYALSVMSAILAMKTKEIAFTLPAMILLYEFMFYRESMKKKIFLLIPFLLTMLIIPLGLLGVSGSAGDVLDDVSSVTRVDSPLSRGEYLLTEMRVIMTYLRLLFVPVNQNLDYDYPVYRSFFNIEVVISFLAIAALITAAIVLLYRSRSGREGERLISFGIFWFFITLSVESSIIPITDVIFEHRLYLPSSGFFIACTSAVFLYVGRKDTRRLFGVALVVFSLAVLIFGGLTFARNRVWQSGISLWTDVVAKSPHNPRAQNGLGFELRKKGMIDDAIRHYEEAIRLKPDYALVINNLGVAYQAKGQVNNAIEQYRKALEIKPGFAEPHNNLGIVYGSMGMSDMAMEEYRIAIQMKPDFAKAYTNLGNEYLKKGLLAEAEDQYEMAIRAQPGLPDPYNNLGIIYANNGRLDVAIRFFERAVALDPDNHEFRQNRDRAVAARMGR